MKNIFITKQDFCFTWAISSTQEGREEKTTAKKAGRPNW